MKIYFAHPFGDRSAVAPLRQIDDVPLQRLLIQLEQVGIQVVDPADSFGAVHDDSARFIHCLQAIESCEVLLVDASNRLGLGVGAEMMFARERGLQVFVVLPEHSYYRSHPEGGRPSVHAFVAGLATKAFLSLEDCLQALCQINEESRNGRRRI